MSDDSTGNPNPNSSQPEGAPHTNPFSDTSAGPEEFGKSQPTPEPSSQSPSSNSSPSTSAGNNAIHFMCTCPHCHAQLTLPSNLAGTLVACAVCNGQFIAPTGSHANPGQDFQGFASKKIAAGICGILLGNLGIHKFIIGQTQAGIIMLLCTVFGGILGACLVFPILLPVAMSVIGFVEGILYLTKSDKEFYDVYAVGGREWF